MTAHLEPFQHIVGVDLDTTHVELHGANMLADSLLVGKVTPSRDSGDIVIGSLFWDLGFESFENLELPLQELLRILAVDAYCGATAHGAFDDGHAAAVGIAAPVLVARDGAVFLHVLASLGSLSPGLLQRFQALQSRTQGQLDVFGPALGGHFCVKVATKHTDLAPRVPVWWYNNLVSVNDIMLQWLALEQGCDAKRRVNKGG